MSVRVANIRARTLRSRRLRDVERDQLVQASLAQTEGEPAVIREAKALANYYRNRDIVIHEGELIVGSQSCLQYDPVEATTPEVFGRCAFASHWPVSDDVQLFFREGVLSGAGNHTTMDYGTILDVGFEGLIDRIDRRIERLSPEERDAQGKRQFLDALRIVAQGYIDLCRRYGDYALALAQDTEDEIRVRELQAIAHNCQRVPAQPPATFWEACQAVWFCFFFLPLSSQIFLPYSLQHLHICAFA